MWILEHGRGSSMNNNKKNKAELSKTSCFELQKDLKTIENQLKPHWDSVPMLVPEIEIDACKSRIPIRLGIAAHLRHLDASPEEEQCACESSWVKNCNHHKALEVWKNVEHMDVSENSGTPKSSILIGFSILNHPFWGTLIFGNTHILVPCCFHPYP